MTYDEIVNQQKELIEVAEQRYEELEKLIADLEQGIEYYGSVIVEVKGKNYTYGVNGEEMLSRYKNEQQQLLDFIEEGEY